MFEDILAEVVDSQGWDAQTVEGLLTEFVCERGLQSDLLAFLKSRTADAQDGN